ncbi:schizont membrane associated cytoadherence protein, putative [Plasmodium vinckei brucechwatti]|uniref:Schizont membrane associated cytoadherence protein, putative n=1 Tax=Plasmodium vinckei brucechwatti TaxID=119398 RepID=A0A6V7RTF4_PLAVN|nr:schizont membrane associated cytoadherence protein, putative [Plasmodium vinckei brucechwatti]
MKYLTHIFFFITFLQFRINEYDNNDKALGKFLNIRNGRFLADYYYVTDENGNRPKKKKKVATYAPNVVPQNGNTYAPNGVPQNGNTYAPNSIPQNGNIYAPNSIPQNGNIYPNISNTQKMPSGFYPHPTQGHQNNPHNLPVGFDFYKSAFIVKLRQNARLIMGSSATAFFLIQDLGIRAMLFLIFASAALAYFTSI